MRTIPPVTGDTRISSALTMCKKLKSISPAIVPAVVIVKGKRTNYRSCLEMIQRGGDNMRKTKKFVESMTSTSFQLNLRLTCIKKEVVMDGIFQGSERNSHVSGPMMHGPGGGVGNDEAEVEEVGDSIQISKRAPIGPMSTATYNSAT